ncbi:protein STRUBBELIG-RECEPTOR FAMILY 3-like [Punica granatum]|uniref:Protein STRUBBELIG-RECEPTOR FAMILY 3-like n=1 Tax=Punica granatum TaxID=22663 RepID=A0A218Y365_PUNGR|nr:protein STRUBBELIG-RECEPTOR FAMILY 3-like [Punica granatum]OWM91271.1 hypothetical protein CDL15_Pgr000215 [Punica granatum]
MGSVKGVVSLRPLVALFFILTAPFCAGLTNLRDVTALNNLFVSLGYPPLRGWLLVGGDPCGDLWQGVECVFSNITALNLTNANLGGELGTTWDFPSIVSIDLSNNHIGGSIPSSLPHSLTQLSLGNNSITGVIPDAFQPLSTLIDLDLSDNNLTGPLPQSFGDLSSLNILHMQNNKLTGLLDVIKDLPFTDLNIEKNLFSGPIPEKLLTVPNFKKDGNPFNTSVLPSPPAPSPVVADGPSPSRAAPPSPAAFPWKQAGGPFPGTPDSPSSGGSMSSKMVLVIAGLGALALILIGGLCLGMRRCTKEDKASKSSKRHDGSPIYSESLPRPNNHVEKAGPRELIGVTRSRDRIDHQRSASDHKPDRLKLDKNRMGLGSTANPPRPCRLGLPAEKVTTIPLASGGSTSRTHPAERVDPANTVARYDIASLQLVTNSFSQVNFIGEGTLGSVYRGELPNGKLLAIKKLETAASWRQSEEEFRGLVSSISMIQHQNIVELVGYCCEHGQRLLIYNFCQNGTLHDALHIDGQMHRKLSWELRIRIALGAARALEYLHETCQPPIVHRNFKSANVLLNDELEVQVSDCGLAPLFISSSQSSDLFLAANGYAAPEVESGAYTWQSDVYSFGVVMLELLTGRRPYERARPRGTQYLARWAISCLHDIDALSKMVDPLLNGFYPIKSLSRFADIISRCIQGEPEFRPLMSEVVQDLMQVV